MYMIQVRGLVPEFQGYSWVWELGLDAELGWDLVMVWAGALLSITIADTPTSASLTFPLPPSLRSMFLLLLSFTNFIAFKFYG